MPRSSLGPPEGNQPRDIVCTNESNCNFIPSSVPPEGKYRDLRGKKPRQAKCLTQVVPTARRELERRQDRATAHQASQAKKPAWDGPTGHPKGADPDKSPPGGCATRRLNRARVRVGRDVWARRLAKRMPSRRHAFRASGQALDMLQLATTRCWPTPPAAGGSAAPGLTSSS